MVARIGGSRFYFDQQRTALDCLIELPDDSQIVAELFKPSTLEPVKLFLQQTTEETVKTNCYKLLHNLLIRIFDSQQQRSQMNSFQSAFNSSNSHSLQKNDEVELKAVKMAAQKSFFDFMKQITEEVITKDLFQPVGEAGDASLSST